MKYVLAVVGLVLFAGVAALTGVMLHLGPWGMATFDDTIAGGECAAVSFLSDHSFSGATYLAGEFAPAHYAMVVKADSSGHVHANLPVGTYSVYWAFGSDKPNSVTAAGGCNDGLPDRLYSTGAHDGSLEVTSTSQHLSFKDIPAQGMLQ